MIRNPLAIMASAALFSPAAGAAMDYLVQRPVAKLTLEYQAEDENRSAPGVGLRSEQTDTFWQSLELRGNGWLYHPDLLQFSYGLDPQWKQQQTAATGTFSRDDDDAFLGYFLDAHVLRQKLHSFKVFLRQSRNEFNSSLSPDNVTETDIARTVWLVNSERFPTTVTLERNNMKFENFFSTEDNSDIVRLESGYASSRHQLNLLGEYVDQRRQIDGQIFNVDRLLMNVNSNYAFSGRARLASTIFGLDSESELSDSRNVLWSEKLMLQHNENLRSAYTARFDSRENESFNSNTRFVSGAIEHQLYENLTSRFELITSQDDFDGGNIDIGQADLNFRYIRKIPAGMLTITNGYEYRVEDNNIDADTSQVLNEPHTLVGTTPEFLARENVDLGSVLVTDLTRSTTYVEGIDYVLTVVGTSVAIERGLFGGIADGETVLVDYAFAAQAAFEADRQSVRFGTSLDLWRALRLHYNFSRVNESLLSGTRPADLSNDRIHRVGASLRRGWSTTTADYEKRDTVRTPLTQKRIQQSFAFRGPRSMSFGASASYAETDFRESGSDSRTLGVAANLRWDLGRWGRLEIDAFSRDIDGESQQTRSDGLMAKWTVVYGDWSGFVRYDDIAESDDLTVQSRDRRLVTFHVARTFR